MNNLEKQAAARRLIGVLRRSALGPQLRNAISSTRQLAPLGADATHQLGNSLKGRAMGEGARSNIWRAQGQPIESRLAGLNQEGFLKALRQGN